MQRPLTGKTEKAGGLAKGAAGIAAPDHARCWHSRRLSDNLGQQSKPFTSRSYPKLVFIIFSWNAGCSWIPKLVQMSKTTWATPPCTRRADVRGASPLALNRRVEKGCGAWVGRAFAVVGHELRLMRFQAAFVR